MRRSCVAIPVLVAALALLVARAEASSEKVPSPLKQWSGPDVSVKLENKGKESKTQKTLTEHKSIARSLFNQRRYEEAAREYQECVELDSRDLEANLGVGYSFYNLRRFDDATAALTKAKALRPEAYDANFWLGLALEHLGRFKEAVPSLETAMTARKDDVEVRRHLFICSLIAGQGQKAGRLYPRLVSALGAGLVMLYMAGFLLLLPFSLKIRPNNFPGLIFSFAWLALFFEGQIAFLTLLSALPSLRLNEIILTACVLAGLPIIVLALIGFARQPWGEPFRWPPRFGSWKVALISLVLLSLNFLMGTLLARFYVLLTHKPYPLQNTIPLIKAALQANAGMAWLSIAVAIPIVEEIIFRGLFYGGFEKYWGIKGAILGSAILFVCAHLQIVGSLYIFSLGLILAWARWRSGSLSLPIVIHSLNNTVALLVLTLFSETGAS